jgi:hypothetical protein
MNIGFHAWADIFNKNRMFKNFPTHEWGADFSNYPLFLLSQKLKSLGHSVSTLDTGKLSDYEKIVFFEFPAWRTSKKPNTYFKRLLNKNFKEMYLVCIETPAVRPNNWVISYHKYFKKIFTWRDELIDNKKYFRIYSTSHRKNENVSFDPSLKRKLFVMLGRNKISVHPKELYSQRVEVIRWFEQLHPNDFDLFGQGWDEIRFRGALSRLNSIDYYIKRVADLFPQRFFVNKLIKKGAKFCRLTAYIKNGRTPLFPSFHGPVVSARETLKKYKFSICFENSSFPGWVTERIFDSFLAGCVPIYLGDPNILSRVPREAFIDMRHFKSYDQLYAYIKNMNSNEYLGYINAIKDFIAGEKSYPFTAEYFAHTIAFEILNGEGLQ